ncbi:MAG: cache domain-containing protein, partial [gamma proteobacterium symbiont of Lucinoma myriamae]|nr:cache domain-containing protein [gamma proteobacterium symbiont of Lucinoma myriamae]
MLYSNNSYCWISFCIPCLPILSLRKKILTVSNQEVLEQVRQITTSLFQQKISDLMFLSKGESFKKYFHDNSKVNWIYLAREFETFSRYKKIYNQIRFIDEQGKEKIRVDYNDGVPAILPRSKLQNKSSRYYFKKSIKLNNYEVYVSPLDLNIENDLVEIPYNPMIRFATPIFDGYGKKRGILVLNYSANELLNKLRDILSFGKGEAMMLNNQGYWLISEHI